MYNAENPRKKFEMKEKISRNYKFKYKQIYNLKKSKTIAASLYYKYALRFKDTYTGIALKVNGC